MIAARRLIVAIFVMAAFLAGFGGAASATLPELEVEFTGISASADFPRGITFRVEYASDQPIERAELFYTTEGQETLTLITAPITDPEAGAVEYFLDLRIYYYPPGIDFVFHWRLTGENGLSAQTESALAPWIDTRFDWTFIETEDVRVGSYDGNAGFAQAILDSAQRAVDRIQVELGAELDQQVRIWAYRSSDDFAGTQAPNTETWIAGVAYPVLKVILAVLPTGDLEEVGRVVPHEISHQVIFQAIENPFNGLPTWLDEGIAVSYQENGFSHFPELVRAAAERGTLFSVRALNGGFPYDGGGATLGYAQSYSIVSFIRSRWGEDALAELIAIYRTGVSHDDAARHALGVDLDELDALWKESVGYQAGQPPAGLADNRGRSADFWGDLLASGALIWLLAAVLAIGIGIWQTVRIRRAPVDQDDPTEFPATMIR